MWKSAHDKYIADYFCYHNPQKENKFFMLEFEVD